MYIELKFAYLGLCLPFGFIWFLFFFFSKETRKKQLSVSIKRAPFGILLDLLYTSDYWSPESVLFLKIGSKMLMLESLLFAFFVSGIAAIVFKAFFGKNISLTKKSLPQKNHYPWKLASCYLCSILLVFVAMGFGMNSIYASTFGYSMIGIAILSHRPQLLKCCLFTSTFLCLLLLVVYSGGRALVVNTEDILQNWWLLYNTRLDVRFCNVPVTELVWGLGYGFTAGAKHNLEFLS